MIGRVVAAAVAIGSLLAGPAARADDAANEALARQYYAAVNARAFGRFLDVLAPDFVDHRSDAVGADALMREAETLARELSGLQITIELILPSGDYVTVIATIRGTAGGAMPADQRVVTYRIVDVWLIREGMLAELWRADTR